MTEFPRHERPPKYPAREQAEIYTYSQWGAIRNGVRLARVTIGTPSVSNVWGIDEHSLLYHRMDVNEEEHESWGSSPAGGGARGVAGERHEQCRDREKCLKAEVTGKMSCFAVDPPLDAAEFSPIAPSLLQEPALPSVDAVGAVELTAFDDGISADPWASLNATKSGDIGVPKAGADAGAVGAPVGGEKETGREVRKAWMQMTALDANSGAKLRFSQVSAGEGGEMWAIDIHGCPWRLLRASTRQKRRILMRLKGLHGGGSRAFSKREEGGDRTEALLPEQADSLMKERISTVAFFQRIGSTGIRLLDIACGGKDCVWAIAEPGAVRGVKRELSTPSMMVMADENCPTSTWLFQFSRGSAAAGEEAEDYSSSEALPHWKVRHVKERILRSISVSPEGDLWAVDSTFRAVQRVQFATDVQTAPTAALEQSSSIRSLVGSPLLGDVKSRIDQSNTSRARALDNQGPSTELEARLELVDDDALWQDFDVTESALSVADKEVTQLAVAKHIIWCATRSGRLLLKTGSSDFREVINGGQQHVVDQFMKQKEMALNETVSGFTLLQSSEFEVSKHRDPLFLMRNSRTKFLEQDFEELEALRVSQIAVNSDGTVRALSKATGGFTYTLRPQKLLLSTPDMFHKLWDNRSTGGNLDIGIWRPFCSQIPEFRALGDYVERSHLRYPSCHCFDAPPGSKPLLAMEDIDVYYSDLDVDDKGFSQAVPLLMDPVRYDQVWDDAGTGAPKPCTVWKPIPPPGYRALGCVVTAERGGRAQPSTHDQVQCVHESVLSSGQFFKAPATKSYVWSTEGMRVAGGNCSFHLVQPLQGVGTAAQTFVASGARAAPAAAKTAFVFSVHPDAFAVAT